MFGISKILGDPKFVFRQYFSPRSQESRFDNSRLINTQIIDFQSNLILQFVTNLKYLKRISESQGEEMNQNILSKIFLGSFFPLAEP